MTPMTKQRTPPNPAGGTPVERTVRRVRIKVGSLISQDHGVGRWPATQSGQDVRDDMEFDAEWTGKWWDCRADDFGRRAWLGEGGGYGNGSIFVHALDGVELVEDEPNAKLSG